MLKFKLSAATLGFILAASASPAFAGDAANGAKVFKKCKACHVVDSAKNKVGPSLQGVFGRTPGSVGGFKYSSAMSGFGASGAVWDAATLDQFLTKPKALVKKTKMSFPGLKKASDRADVIAYLQSN